MIGGISFIMNYTKVLYAILIIGLLILLAFGGTYAAFIGLGCVYIVAILDDIFGRNLTSKKFLIKTVLFIIGLLVLYLALRFL